MKTKLVSLGILGFGAITAALILGVAAAQTPSGGGPSIQYPVAELGNCADKEACKAYCDKPGNIKACVAFAEKNNLMSEKEITLAKKFIDAGAKGPGGCTGKESCEAYCDDISRIDECITFAEKNGLLSPDELAEAKQVQAAIARGVTPPPCGNKKACDVYCDDPANIKACISFAEAAGFLKDRELEDAKKMVAAVERGVKPPPCRGKKACDEYCSAPENMEVCMTFAKEAGFMSPEEAADSEKMLQALRKGVKPPACRGKEECDKYCQSEEHIEECMNFAVAAGFMNEKEAEMAKKTGGKGPGGCFGKEVCEAFCQNPANQETCMNFAVEHGMMSKEDIERMRQGGMQGGEGQQSPPPGAFDQMPPEVAACLQGALGAEGFEKMKRGELQPSGEEGRKVGQCFQMMGGPGQSPGGPGMPPPGGDGFPPPGDGQGLAPFSGPGGCTSQESCRSFCESNPGACQNFPQSPAGQMPSPDGSMPPPGTYPMPQEGYMQPGGNMPPPQGAAYPAPSGDAQYQEQFRQQYEQQYQQQQYTQPMEQYIPPADGLPPPPGASNPFLQFLGMIIRGFTR